MENTLKPSAQKPDTKGLLWKSTAQEKILYPEDKKKIQPFLLCNTGEHLRDSKNFHQQRPNKTLHHQSQEKSLSSLYTEISLQTVITEVASSHFYSSRFLPWDGRQTVPLRQNDVNWPMNCIELYSNAITQPFGDTMTVHRPKGFAAVKPKEHRNEK